MSICIRGGKIVDGTGAPARRADIRLEGDRIVSVATESGPADLTVDASGLVVAPGFIDIHSHSDHLLLARPLADSKLLQGVTCEIGGNCGFSAAPVDAECARTLLQELLPSGIKADWDGLGRFLQRLAEAGIGPNFASLVGHGNIRGRVLGHADREATPAELAQMQALVAQSLREGACGLSFGLIYTPGCYANTEELAAVARPVADNGFCSAHIRNEGSGLLTAVDEMIEVARRSGVSLQLSHHKVGGRANWGLVKESLARIDAARDGGLDVTADVYPYVATNTGLAAVLPDWMRAGGTEMLLARLRDPGALARLAAEWGSRGDNPGDWDEYAIARTFSAETRALTGLRIGAVCRERGERPLAVVTGTLLADQARTVMMRFCIAEEDVEEVLRRPWVMVGSDASAKTLSDEWGHPHPRAYGTFARVLAHYVREHRMLSLEDAVRRMTALPAWRARLVDRGRIAEGMKADLVIFDPDAIRDEATYDSPVRPPAGIHSVFVNGVAVVAGGSLLGTRPGEVLRSFRDP